MLFGSIEAGGTKFVCAIGNEKGIILEKEVFETLDPESTMNNVITFFKNKNITVIDDTIYAICEVLDRYL